MTTLANLPQILKKLGIESLNEMQEKTIEAFGKNAEVVLLSPTGTGKTLAFVLPLLEYLDPNVVATQALILTPSRELAIQIEQVIRDMGTGFKTNAIYGGRSQHKDRMDLNHAPTILIGTPGRIADHIRRENIDTSAIQTLILDEFDKSLEVGFEKEMKEIVSSIPNLKKKVLTSATQKVDIPDFVGISNATRLNYTGKSRSKLEMRKVTAVDKLTTLADLLYHIGKKNGIIFCNFKESISLVSEALEEHGIDHACFYGGMEQLDREQSLIKFRNGTERILLATDLAARGLDVPEMDFIVHYELPFHEEEFIHRNGRTARMKSSGTAYIIQREGKPLPPYMYRLEEEILEPKKINLRSDWETLYITGGRKDKISKGDIAGLFFKTGGLEKGELGVIELKSDCAYVSVARSKARRLVDQLNNSRLKTKKVRISVLGTSTK
ncbi:DEAD/DEAH box helicase [Phaeocystidibacter marisrubri]|uniref:DEAD/DEAH box helicase n=1 Tax=Phaeocystidibacter marisrubri TaxID=1577780 RepID=A0A6L3ZDB4_9FLAO|nr:DEAD/DEAH box helicase [Phaeocystidibacter marisrubri]KAB2815835.1 DEAD/DEAH box helicase [Phaeocystidibacter marisrubri]GGH65957.1 helicase [Phaeocystidibacter marisrubri]